MATEQNGGNGIDMLTCGGAPQMSDAAEVFAGITRRAGIRYTALVPNRAGRESRHGGSALHAQWIGCDHWH
jgi:hypothetical protein